jgi:hypothetical protein
MVSSEEENSLEKKKSSSDDELEMLKGGELTTIIPNLTVTWGT